MIPHTQPAIVVSSKDYKDYDKVVRLFTPDGGIVRAVLKGVKRERAKLKFASQPFAFCEYSLAEKNGFYTVTNALQIESLFGLSKDPDCFMASSLMLECADIAVSSLPSPALFVYLLKCFQAMLYKDKDPYMAAALFLYKTLINAGYAQENTLLNSLTIETLPNITEDRTDMKLLFRLIAAFERYLEVKLHTAKMLLSFELN